MFTTKTPHWKALRLGLAALALGTMSTAALAQDFTVHSTLSGDPTTYYISRKAVRKIFTTTGTDVIYLFDQGKLIYLNHKQNSYREVTLTEARSAFNTSAVRMSPEQRELFHKLGYDAAPSVTRIGPGETIAGYATEKYLVVMPTMRTEVWAAPALEMPPAYYDLNGLLKKATMIDMSRFDEEMRKVKGMILKKVVTMTMPNMQNVPGMSLTETTISVDRNPIAPSTFEVPGGYKLTRF